MVIWESSWSFIRHNLQGVTIQLGSMTSLMHTHYGRSNFFLLSFQFWPQNCGQTDYKLKKKTFLNSIGRKEGKNRGKTKKGKVSLQFDCGSGQCIRVRQVSQKLCLRNILLCSIKVTSVGQKNWIRIRTQGLPEGPHLEIHPLSLGKTYIYSIDTAILYVW